MMLDFIQYFYDAIDVYFGVPVDYELGYALYDSLISFFGYVFGLFLILLPFGIVYKICRRGD